MPLSAHAMLFDPDEIENTTNPEARLNLDAPTYTGLPVGLPLPGWLRLLRDGTPDYRAQPYQQLAAAYRAAGHDSEVRRILIAQRRDQIHRRALTGRGERAWVRITGPTLGYGYQPWRALLALLAITAVAVALAVTLGSMAGWPAPLPPARPARLPNRSGSGSISDFPW